MGGVDFTGIYIFFFKFFIYLLVYIRLASSLFSMRTSIYVLATILSYRLLRTRMEGEKHNEMRWYYNTVYHLSLQTVYMVGMVWYGICCATLIRLLQKLPFRLS